MAVARRNRRRETIAAVLLVGACGLVELIRYGSTRELQRDLDDRFAYLEGLVLEADKDLHALEERAQGPYALGLEHRVGTLEARIAHVESIASRTADLETIAGADNSRARTDALDRVTYRVRSRRP